MRETLYQQCFDEMIRQITINCAERGFLLVRVRDEFRQQLTAYQGLYDSSIAYGMRHALVAEASKAEIRSRIETLRKDCDDLEDLISDLETQCKEVVK
jgi:dynein light intermediate chain, axonemal